MFMHFSWGVYPLSAQSSRRASRVECEEPRPHPSRLPAPYILTSLLPSLVASLFPSSTIAALPSGGEMSFSQRFDEIRTGFERPFWVANITELFERLSYYAVFTVIVRYLHENLKFSAQEA